MKRQTMYNRLSDIACTAYESILHMSTRQRRTALRTLAGLTGTNCGWMIYEMRVVLTEFVRCASSSRCKVRRAGK